MSGITKTIPQKEGIEALEVLYDGPVGEFEFHMAGTITLKCRRLCIHHLARYDGGALPNNPN